MKKLHPLVSNYAEAKHFIEQASVDVNFFYFNNSGGYESFVLVGGFKPYRTNISLINTYQSPVFFRLVINETGHKTTYDLTKQEFIVLLNEIAEIAEKKKIKLSIIYSKNDDLDDLTNRVQIFGINNFTLTKYKNQTHSYS